MTVNLKSSREQKKALEKLGVEDKARVDALEMTNQNLEGALEEVKQQLEETQKECNQKLEQYAAIEKSLNERILNYWAHTI